MKQNLRQHIPFFGTILLTLMLVLLFPVAGHADTPWAEITEETFPDKNFREYVLENCSVPASYYGMEGDGKYTLSVMRMDVSGKNISSLKGIEYFAELEYLNCGDNRLTEINLSSNNMLEELSIYKNQLTKLDVSSLSQLKFLSCYENKISSLDLTGCPELTQLGCSDNKLKMLNLDANTALRYLSCYGNQITALDLDNNTELINLDCQKNQLTSLDLSSCTNLTDLSCWENQLASLELPDSIEDIDCQENVLTSLDVSACSDLISLYCSNNKLKTLDVSNCASLENLECCENQLTTLDVSNNLALQSLECFENQLTTLDVSNNPALTYLDCSDNHLTSLDLTHNTELEELWCLRNYLNIEKLDLSKNTKLKIALIDEQYGDSDEEPTPVVEKKKNTISAKNITRNFNLKKQSFKIGATALGGAKLSYKSGNSDKISVDQSGKVTVKAAYVGKATITITAAETSVYAKTTMTIQVRVNPGVATLKSVKNTAKKKIEVKWKTTQSTKSTGYQIQYSSSKKYTKSTTKTVTVKGVKTSSKTISNSKFKKGKTFYVRIRAYLKYGSDTYYSPWASKSVKIVK